MQTVKTASTTMKTASSPEKMAKFGSAGNTKGTRLPNGGSAKMSKKKGTKGKS